MEEKKKLAYLGYVIDRGIPFEGKQKAVDFFDGVGILDYEVLAREAGAATWFEHNSIGEIVGINPGAVSMKAFVDYWINLGAKVTEINEDEAKRLKKLLENGKPIPDEYLKRPEDTRKIAGAKQEIKSAPSMPVDEMPKKKGMK